MSELVQQLDTQELELERSKALPKAVYNELHEKYQWCLACGSPSGLESHHIVFRSQGGPTNLINLVLLCYECHDRSHGLIVAGEQPFTIKRVAGELLLVERTGEFRILDEKTHVPTANEGEVAFALHDVILTYKREVEKMSYHLGKALLFMQENEIYKVLGYDTFNAYIASPELSFSRSWAYRMMSIARDVERLNLPPEQIEHIDKEKLAIILPKATPETVADLLADAEETSRGDLRRLYAGADEFTHEGEHEHQCFHCGHTNRYPGN